MRSITGLTVFGERLLRVLSILEGQSGVHIEFRPRSRSGGFTW